tara:strand:- start:80 stop:850 length:771 start_codon:yes stop_codon:yes gene_type:complete
MNNNLSEIVCKYNNLLINYNKFFFNNIIICNKKKLLLNIYFKGLKLIENIFNISFLYLDNYGDVFNLCEKSYIYFIEFINQINISSNIEFNIELTIKDAIIFCYKKTILNYENSVNNKKQTTNNILYIIGKYINILNSLNIIYIIEINNKFYDNDLFNEKIFLLSKKISLYLKKINNNNILEKSIINFSNFIDYICEYVLNNIDSTYDYNLINNIIEKYITKEIYICNNDINIINENIFDIIKNNENNLNILFNFE